MEELLKRLADCIESGKVDRESRYPPAMAGEDGARELTARALEEGVRAEGTTDFPREQQTHSFRRSDHQEL